MSKEVAQPIIEVPNEPEFNATYSIASNNITTYTHGFFKYPCKFIPHIPRWAINKYASGDNKTILDPFCGSGTTLVEGVLSGKTSFGIELDPLGRVLTEVKTTAFDDSDKKALKKTVKDIKSYIKTAQNKYFIPEIPNISLWFTSNAIKKLGVIKDAIEKTSPNKEIRKFLLICFASIIRLSSNAENQSPKPYVSKRFKKKHVDIYNLFFERAEKYSDKILEFSNLRPLGKSKIIGNDGLNIDKKYANKINLVVTSPPYINAFDYVRSLKLENYWLGLMTTDDLAEMRKKCVGTENIKSCEEKPNVDIPRLQYALSRIFKIDKKRAWIVYRFFEDIKRNLAEVKRSLKKKGVYCIVIGDSNIRGVDVISHLILIDLARKLGYTLDNLFSYEIKNRYLRFPRQGRGGLIKKDWVISLVKSNG